MLATPVTIGHRPRTGPRPINLSRDSYPVLRLLDRVFGPLTDTHGRRLVTERVSLSYASPMRVRLSMLTQGFVPGFVWEQDGAIVGNLSLIASEWPGRYLIANVAVHPDFRRRGIAASLLREALAHVRDLQGREVLLQVEHDNQAAIDLYERYDFTSLGVMNRWQAVVARLNAIDPGDRPANIRELRRADWRRAYALDVAAVDPALNWPTPPRLQKYRRGLLEWASDFLSGRRIETWAAYPAGHQDPGRSPLGLAHLRGAWSLPYHLQLRVSQDYRGQLERPLLAKAIRRLRYQRGGLVRLNHPASDDIVNGLLREANFGLARTLTVMRRSFDEQV